MHLTPDKEAAVSSPGCCGQCFSWSRPLILTRLSFSSVDMFCKYRQIRVPESEVQQDNKFKIKINHKLLLPLVKCLYAIVPKHLWCASYMFHRFSWMWCKMCQINGFSFSESTRISRDIDQGQWQMVTPEGSAGPRINYYLCSGKGNIDLGKWRKRGLMTGVFYDD